MPRPTLSVVMPVYNTLKYLDAAVESILTQSFDDFEFLIFDDGSTDGSKERLQQYANQDSRIKLFSREHGGLTLLLNEGLKKAKGEFIARMDSDDISEPSRFKAQICFLQQHPDYVAVGSEILRIDPGGLPIGIQGKLENHEDIVHAFLGGKGGAIIHPSAMFKRLAIKEIGGYRPDCEPAEDLDLFIRLSKVGRLANLPQVLMKYRLHFKRTTDLRRQEQLQKVKLIVQQARVERGLGKLPDNWAQSQKTLTPRETRAHWARTATNRGHFQTGLKHSLILLLLEPLSKNHLRMVKHAVKGLFKSNVLDSTEVSASR
ncbi:MAG: glycosyltransferase [Cyanobacteria bacterium J06560_5]